MTSEELKAAYALSARPYIEAPGPVPASALGLKSWRFVFELNSMCNLRCALCMPGNREGYDYHPGVMDLDLMERILDKMKSENPNAIVCTYGNSEPFLHPHIDRCVASIKARGFRTELSSNLSLKSIPKMHAVMAAHPDLFTVSVSGFTQETYQKAHRGGDIELVKRNMQSLSLANYQGNYKVDLAVAWHMYNDNLHEMDAMKNYAESLGFRFMISWARVITIENTVQALRYMEKLRTGVVGPYKLGPDGLDLNVDFPPVKPEFLEAMKRLRFPPERAVDLYARFPVAPVCLIADVFCYIRWDGRVQLCAWCDDMRLTLGNYLEMTQEQMSEKRRGHPLCQECLRFRLGLYFHVCDAYKWDSGGRP